CSALSMALRNVLLLGGGAALLVATSPRLAGFVALVVPLVVLPVLVIGRRVRRLSRAGQDRLSDVGGHLDESFANLRTVQAFGHEDADRSRFAALVDGALRAAQAHVRARASLASVVIGLAFGAVAVILWVGGRDVLAGRLTGGDLAAFVFYAVVVASATGALSEIAGELQRAAGAAERLLELLALRPTIAAPAAPAAPAPLPAPLRGEVAFAGVTFAYPARPDRPALDTLSFTVAPGERVALVGPSGAGKTTVFELLLRFRDPQAGVVTLDGVDIRDLDPRALRAAFALVPQEPAIFSGTLAENIRYGRPDADDRDVAAAAEAAAVAEFAAKLPDGLATVVGERGVRLSGGQRQRVAIARAVLRDAPVLLLDEATSALDAESERAVQQALARLMDGRTSLVIAHRLATVAGADRILVLDDGRLVAQGRHAELVAGGGLYARLASLQFRPEAAE
ncbi:MAG: ATP-binding cassette domain-containing protein, partial [Alphaproteobacteria bacterium]